MSACRIRDLSVLSHSQGFTLWFYKAPAIADVLASGFFNDVADMIADGDHMHVSAPNGGAVLHLSNVGARVHVTAMTAMMPAPILHPEAA